MADRSWGDTPSIGIRIRTNDRVTERARLREARGTERAEAMASRMEARAAARTLDTAAREQARTERREREVAAATGDPHAAAAARHRSSGRKDVVREQRDTSAYTTIVDIDRIRELARRGASLSGLAGAFGISEGEIAGLLAE